MMTDVPVMTAVGGGFTEEESLIMPAIITWPTVVEEALKTYGSLFVNEPERRHFAEYLTGLLVAQRKTVSGINAEFAVTTDQSCLNRWITEVAWDVQALNERRVTELQRDPSTRYATQGVIALDNTRIAHDGTLIEAVGWFWDHAEAKHQIAHDYLIAHYVCPSGKHYGLECRRFRKEADCSPEEFKDHPALFVELADWVVAHELPGDFTFDCYFTSAPILNRLHSKHRGSVGDLKTNRKVEFGGRVWKAAESAASIPVEARKVVQIGERRQWYFTKTIRIPTVDHPVRLVILWDRKNGAEPRKMRLTNKTCWEITRILRVSRKRWTGTETFHRDGKQHLGMGDGQLRSGEGQTRHLYLVLLAHSLLVTAMHQGRACEWARVTLTTIGEACRAVLRDTLQRTITWAIERATVDAWTTPRICQVLQLT